MKYRKISPCIWNDAKVRELSDKGKLALLFLLTHPHMTPLGAIRANAPGLACELGWSEKVFRKAFGEVLALGIAREDPRAPLVWFPNFLRHNMPESPNVVRAWVGAFGDLPESPLKRAMLERTAAIVRTLGEGFRNAFGEAFPGVLCGETVSPNPSGGSGGGFGGGSGRGEAAGMPGLSLAPSGGVPEALPEALPIPFGEALPKGSPNQEQEQEQEREAGRGTRAGGAIRDAVPGRGAEARAGEAGGAAGMPGGRLPSPFGGAPARERPFPPSGSPAGRSSGAAHPQRAAFLSCWEAYPVRQSEEDAWCEWLRLWECRALPEPRAVREAIRLMLAEDTRWRRGKIPKMAKWLAGKGWNDRPFVEPQGGLGAARPRADTAAQRRAQDNDDMARMLLHARRAHAQSGFHAANAGQSGAALPAGGQDARAVADFGGGLGGRSRGLPA